MRTIKKAHLLAVMLLAMITLLTICAFSEDDHGGILDYGSCGENLTWTMYNDGLLEISGEGEMQNYGYSFISGNSAPWGKYLSEMKTLKLNEGITAIGDGAFYNCRNFTGDLIIPDSVISIGKAAFEECWGFTYLKIGKNVTTICPQAFNTCKNITGNLTIPDSVTTIGRCAFMYCHSFTSLTIGNNVTTIGDEAFCMCWRMSGQLIIPSSVTSIDYDTFHYCELFSSVLFEGDAPIMDSTIFSKCADDIIIYCYKSHYDSFINNPNYTEEDETFFGYQLVILDDATPSFSGHTLALSGKIGVMFRVSFPADFDPENCCMEFAAADGRTSTVDFDSSEAIADTNDRYFTFYVNAMELAENITATLHYGDGKTLTDEYSALTYIKYVQDNMSDDRYLLSLVNALNDYGYYMQNSGWNDEFPTHTLISDIADPLASSDIDSIRDIVAGMRVKNEFGDSGIIDSKISLTLNSDTRINIFIKPDENVTINSCRDQNGNNIILKKKMIQGETYFQFATEKITALNLGREYKFTIETTSGTAAVTASAMSYADAVLKEGSAFASEKQYAMAAFYNYYMAAVTYKEYN